MNYLLCDSCHSLNRVPPEKLGTGAAKCGRCGAGLSEQNKPVHVNDADLEKLIRVSPVPVLVDFYADWCGPCRSLAPVLEQLANKKAGKMLVVKVNTDHDQRHAASLGVSGIPAVFLFKGGEVVNQATGARPLNFWEGFTQPHVG